MSLLLDSFRNRQNRRQFRKPKISLWFPWPDTGATCIIYVNTPQEKNKILKKAKQLGNFVESNFAQKYNVLLDQSEDDIHNVPGTIVHFSVTVDNNWT